MSKDVSSKEKEIKEKTRSSQSLRTSGGQVTKRGLDRESAKGDVNVKRAKSSAGSSSESKDSATAKDLESGGAPSATAMKFPSNVHPELINVHDLIFQPLGLLCTSKPVKDVESAEYGAFDLSLNGQPIKFRFAKVTPTKNGQFVTLWARDGKTSPIRPYDLKDPVDLFVISVRDKSHHGHFLFPKSILAQRDIVSKGGKGGKRATRVYPPWVKTESKQATTTQEWQIRYFLPQKGEQVDLVKARRLLACLFVVARKV